MPCWMEQVVFEISYAKDPWLVGNRKDLVSSLHRFPRKPFYRGTTLFPRVSEIGERFMISVFESGLLGFCLFSCCLQISTVK